MRWGILALAIWLGAGAAYAQSLGDFLGGGGSVWDGNGGRGAWRTCLNVEHRFTIQRSVDACTRILDARPSRVTEGTALLQRADAYEDSGRQAEARADTQRAYDIFDELVRGDRREAYAYYVRATAYEGLEDYDRAFEDYGRALEFDHDMSAATTGRADILFRRGQFAQAVAAYDEAYRQAIEEGDEGLYVRSMRCKARAAARTQWEEAERDCSRAQRRVNNRMHGLLARAYLRFMQGRYQESYTDYAEALAHDPFDSEALYGRGVTALRLNRPDGQADIDRAMTLDVDEFDYLANAGLRP